MQAEKVLSYEELMTAMSELREQQKKNEEENEKEFVKLRELQKETDEQIKRNDERITKKLDRITEKLDHLDEIINGVNKNIGYHAEQYFQNALDGKLSDAARKMK